MYSTTKLYPDGTEDTWLIEPMLEVLTALQTHSSWTWQHLGDVARYAVTFGRALFLSNEDLLNLQCAALLHDVGKIMVSPEILEKTTPLDRDEWYTITKHPVLATKVLREKTLPAGVISAARSHHERFDGTGYPLGLAGENIPLTARTLSIADACDAMMNERPYRPALTLAQILSEIDNGASKQFDPELVRTLRPIIERGLQGRNEKLRLRVISDDPQVFRQLWFAAQPYGWELEAWPRRWASFCPPELAQESTENKADATIPETARITIVDGHAIGRLTAEVINRIPEDAIWIDPTRKVKRSLYTPLDLRDIVGQLQGSEGPLQMPVQRKKIRVIIADPYHLFRQVLRRCLDERDDVDVVAEVATPEAFRHATTKHKFDVAILASDLLKGTHTTAPLKPGDIRLDYSEITTGHLRPQPTIVLVADEDVETFGAALYDAPVVGDSWGATGSCIYIHRGAPAERLVEAMKSMLNSA